MKKIILATSLYLISSLGLAAELAGVFVDDEIKTINGQTLILNGVGLREKFWVDVYVGSLYLPSKSKDVAEILSRPGPWRVQMDIIYKEVTPDQFIETWREGFENNQTPATLKKIGPQMQQFYGYFDRNVKAREQYAFDYIPEQGVLVTRNGKELGLIAGEDFKTALLEIWLGNKPGDKRLKKGMLGL